MNYKIHIIIVTYNAMKWAERCFSSLRKSSVPLSAYVVDNGSTDGTQDYINKNFPEVDFHQSPENLGFGRANNLAIEKAFRDGAEFFYLMNQDAWIFENTFSELIKLYENYENKEEIGIISPMHLDGSEKLLDFHFERYLARSVEKNRIISELFLNSERNFVEVDFVNAAHWFLPKSTIEKVGGFNPFFFHGAEDYDYVNRIRYHQKKILVSLNSIVVHDAKKLISDKPESEKTKDRHTSIRMQRETKFMNPHEDFNTSEEIKRMRNDAIKLRLKGNSAESKFHAEMLKYFKPLFGEIEKNRQIAMHNKNPFLNL